MYMRLTRGHIDPDRIDEAMSQIEHELLTAVTGLPGCQGYVGGVDRASGRLAGVTIWDTKDHARWFRTILGDLAPRLLLLGVRLEPPEVIEVSRAWP
jgi:hypothetical protein